MLGNCSCTRVRIKLLVTILGLIVVVVAATVPGPSGFSEAEAGAINTVENVCPNPSGSYTNIVVGAGQQCLLKAATVNGNIQVQPGGILDVTDSRVAGNILATRAVDVALTNASIGGNVLIQNAVNTIAVDDSHIRGSVTLNANTAIPDRISATTIGGILTCQGNNPAPTSVLNSAARFVGQCTG